jgi:mRNA interferase RelE/StbE
LYAYDFLILVKLNSTCVDLQQVELGFCARLAFPRGLMVCFTRGAPMKITFAKQAKKAVERLDVAMKHRIRNAISQLPNGDVKRLQGYTELYRLRVGKWRVLFSMTAEEIYVENILSRGDAYK